MAPPPFVSKSLLHFSSFRHKKFIITKKKRDVLIYDGRQRRPVLDGRALVFGRALGKGARDYYVDY